MQLKLITDNNAQLTELIDQYQFAGQDRLAADVAERGMMAASGRTGRGAMTSAVARSSALGRGDALMANNLLRARFGTERANERIRTQLIDNMQSAYNRVGFTPKRTPGGLFTMTPEVKPTYSGNDMLLDNLVAGFDGLQTAAGAYAAGAGALKPQGGGGINYDEGGLQQGPMVPDNPNTWPAPPPPPPVEPMKAMGPMRKSLSSGAGIGGIHGPNRSICKHNL